MSQRFLWYIPNEADPGHRGDQVAEGHNSLATLTRHAEALERHGWDGALIGAGWGRPDTVTVATALAAKTTTFQPLIAVRPGYWLPAHFAAAAATLDRLSGGRVLVNIVSGPDEPAAYGDDVRDQPQRYARTKEFMRIVRRLWTEPRVTHLGEHFGVQDSTLAVRPVVRGPRRHPTLYFGGASVAAEEVAATEADVQLFWGEPLDGVAERIDRLRRLSRELGRRHLPLEFGLRVTTVVRETTDQAWAAAEAKVAAMASGSIVREPRRHDGAGQRRLAELAARGEVLDDNLYTAPQTVGGNGAASTWLVGSAEDVARSLDRYRDLGVSHFVLSDTPYLPEIERQGGRLLPLLREVRTVNGASRFS